MELWVYDSWSLDIWIMKYGSRNYKIWVYFEFIPVTKYSVQTVTGKESGGGTDSKVYITLFGKDGDSGRRRLNISEDNKDKFEKGKVCTSCDVTSQVVT